MTPTSASADPLPLYSRQDWCWQWMRSYPVDSAPIESTETLLLRGPLDVGALRDALAEIETRHDALRLRLTALPGPDPSAAWPGQTLRPDPGRLTTVRVRPEELTAEAKRILGRPLDLTDRMVRATLLRAGEREHLLVVQLHHLIFDGSCHHLFRELLAEGYTRRVAPGRSATPGKRRTEPESYTGLIRREREPGARSRVRERAAALAAELRAHGTREPLPGDAGAVVADTRFASVSLDLTADRTRRLLRRSRAERVTPHTVLLAALARAVATEYDRDRLVCSVYTHGRTSPAAHETLGLFSNVVSVPLETAGGPLPEYVRSVHEGVRRASDTADLPFTEVASRILDRPSDGGAYCRSALAHLELRLTGVTGPLPVDQYRSTALAPEVEVIPQIITADHPVPVFNGLERALACAATLFTDVRLKDGSLIGELWFERGYHDGERIARVAENYHDFMGRLSDGV
ncbi:condensation domain-containing protein [Streptomyces sp. NPDC059894]|uniref:condensation domain-containing protein n=1 Tax=unclassified Streptomyces TaxID=2593676 RepID=UPI00365FD983